MSETTFTEKQIANWRAFEKVRKGGKFNTFDERAHKASKLSEEDYRFCMRNYSPLCRAAALENVGG